MFNFLVRRPIFSLILSFFFAILAGALLLKLPISTVGGISFLDAMFTATSATCVTGLTIVNTAHNFTFFGKVVILTLIQLGGLGIMTAGAFVFLVFKKMGIGSRASLKEILEESYISDVKRSTIFIILSTLLIEGVGAVLLFFRWNKIFPDTGAAIFNSVFHSISAFCNAGFSTFFENLEGFRGDIFVNTVIMFLIILGGIGFLVIDDCQKKIVSLFKKRRYRLGIHSKIVIIFTAILIFAGAVLFMFFEMGNLAYLSRQEFVLTSFFQSVTARTCGFNTVNIGSLASPTLLLLMFLMFIGAAPTSTAGGVKVTSLALVFFGIAAFLKRKDDVVVFGREIPKSKFHSVFILIFFYFLFCLVVTFALLYTEKGNLEQILFEVISATGTVGISTGITPLLTNAGKVLIILSMFVGRLLPISLAVIGTREIIKSKIAYPEEKIILG